MTVANAISGTGSLTTIGSGTLILTGANSYSGVTTISAGTLQIGNGAKAGALGTGAIVDNGALSFDESGNFYVGNPISGSGSLTTNGGGFVVGGGPNSYTGGTTIDAGSHLQLSLGTLGTGAVQDNGFLLVTPTGSSVTIGNAITGSGQVDVGGTLGTLILTNSGNTFSGGVSLSLGLLQAGAANAFGTGGVDVSAAPCSISPGFPSPSARCPTPERSTTAAPLRR